MTYTGESGEVSARYRSPETVEQLTRDGGSTRFVAPGSHTNGQFGLFEWHMAGSSGGAFLARHDQYTAS